MEVPAFAYAPSSGLDQLYGGSEPGNQPLPLLSPDSCRCSGTCASQTGSGSACSCPCHPGCCPPPPRNRGNSRVLSSTRRDQILSEEEALGGRNLCCSESVHYLICTVFDTEEAGEQERSATGLLDIFSA